FSIRCLDVAPFSRTRRLSSQRQCYREDGSSIIGILGPGSAPERLGRLANDVEAEAGTFDRAHTLVRAEETLEQLIALVRRDADAVVANANHDSSLAIVRLLLRARDLDESLRLCRIGVLDRVGEIILDAELDHGGADLDVRHSRADADVDLRALCSFAYLPHRFTHCFGELHVSVLAWVVTIRPRENQNVLHCVSHLSR